MERFAGVLGFLLLLGIAFALSSNRSAIRWKTVGWGIALQLFFAVVVLKGEWMSQRLAWIPFSPGTFSVGILLQIVLFLFLSKRTAFPLVAMHWIQAIIGVQILFCLLKFYFVANFFIYMLV